MSRRLVAAAVALVLLALVAGGALGGVFAADTTGSGLLIDAADGPNGDYADLSNDQLRLDLSEGGGVSNDAITRIDAVFVVTNDRSYAAPVWVSDNSTALGFYDSETGDPINSRETAKNLTAGESLRVGVTVDMRGSSVEDVESTSNFVVETLVKDATSTETPTDRGTDDGNSTTDTDGTETNGSATPTATDDGSGGSGGSDGSNGGGGGGGGGGQSSGSESSYSVYNTTEGATVQVREGLASDPFTAETTGDSPYVTGADTDVTAFTAGLTFDQDDWRVEITDPTSEPQAATSVDGDVVSYFRVDAYGVEAPTFERIGVNASVSLPDGTAAEDVTFYRNASDGWQRVGATHEGGDRFSTDLGGFGEVAVVIESGGSSGGNGGGSGDGGSDGGGDGQSGGDSGSGSTDATATPDGNESADPVVTGTATAVERLQDPLALNTGLGGATIVVFALFTVWLGARGRIGRGGSGGL